MHDCHAACKGYQFTSQYSNISNKNVYNIHKIVFVRKAKRLLCYTFSDIVPHFNQTLLFSVPFTKNIIQAINSLSFSIYR